MDKPPLRVGLIGCGVISEEYLSSSLQFDEFSIVKCADRNPERAARRGAAYNIPAATPDEVFADPDIDLVLNLTPPQAHKDVNLAALNAGKHVYSEKPFALNLADADIILEAAAARGLVVASAPDSFLGATQRKARELVRDGVIGEVFGGAASIMWRVGDHSDHPNIASFFRQGAGPLFDMGPYYITALVNLLGPVKRVGAMGRKLAPLRRCLTGKSAGKEFPVEINTHTQGLLEFDAGAIVSLNASFDVWRHQNPRVELYGSSGTLMLPEPSGFGGDMRLFKPGSEDWEVIPPEGEFQRTTRGLGLAELARALAERRPPRCSGMLARHVLAVMCALEESAASSVFVTMPKPL